MNRSTQIIPELRPIVDEENCFHSTLIICPWCYSVTDYKYENGSDECTICRRTITEADIDDYLERQANDVQP